MAVDALTTAPGAEECWIAGRELSRVASADELVELLERCAHQSARAEVAAAAKAAALRPEWFEQVADRFRGRWELFVELLVETPGAPAEVWALVAERAPVPVVTAAEAVTKLAHADGAVLRAAELLFERSIDPVVTGRSTGGGPLDEEWFYEPDFTAAALAVSKNHWVLDESLEHFTGAYVPAPYLWAVADRLVEVTATGRDPRRLGRAVHALVEMCESRGHLLVSHVARAAARLAERAGAESGELRDAIDGLWRQVRLDELADPGGAIRMSFDELLVCASSPERADIDTAAQVIGLSHRYLRRPEVFGTAARMLARNPAAPEEVLVELAASPFRSIVADVLSERAPLPVAVAVAYDSNAGSLDDPRSLCCDSVDPGRATALVANELWRREVGRDTYTHTVDLTRLVRFAAWDEVSVPDLLVPVYHEMYSGTGGERLEAPVLRWLEERFADTTAWELASEMLGGFPGTFGELAAVVEAATV